MDAASEETKDQRLKELIREEITLFLEENRRLIVERAAKKLARPAPENETEKIAE